MKPSTLLGLLGAAAHAVADPTWPSSVDELEEIMFQLNSFQARKFSGSISPCTSEASGPGRQNAAEWLRTAFHDMSTANRYFNRGGLDASLQYELNNGDNTGPGHQTTLQFMSTYISRKSSLSDLIALGVYASVRSCGGPIVPFRAGRKDATESGGTGVPQPQNSVLTFQQQFDRMGFTNEEMIQVTACGHTLGGVHTAEFPDLVPEGTGVNGAVGLDTTVAVFDNKVVTEYLNGTTINPLVVGPSVRLNKHSDFKVFNSDGNVTMRALADTTTFTNACRAVLQKMIDVVPPGVTLSEPIVPYAVKPVNFQLTLSNGGNTLLFTGYIRVRTTQLPIATVRNLVLNYKDRTGGTDCGSAACRITITVQGAGQGFDDTFSFFPISANLPTASGISSFTITMNMVDGTQQTFDNNGAEYPLQDAVLLQTPQSCLLGSTGSFTIAAAVRNDRLSEGAQAIVTYKVPQTNSPVPLLQDATVNLQRGICVGKYTLFSATYTITGGMPYESRVEVKNGAFSDAFKSVNNIGGTCRAFTNPTACDGGSTDPITSSTASSTSSAISSTTSSLVPTSVTTSTSSTSPSASPHHRDVVGGYKLVSCWKEGASARALNGESYAADDMTLESCEEFCSNYVYWGTEYGRECYCGNSLASSSESAALEDCNMLCGGDKTQYCGAGNRLELYSTTASQTSAPTTSTSSTPEPTTVHREVIGKFNLVGCWTEGVGARALSGAATSSATLTNEQCAEFCTEWKYFGTEYGSECYCGDVLAPSSASAPLEECNMPCGGEKSEFCGAGNRLELYMNPDSTGRSPEQPAAAGDFVWLGCQTEATGARALNGPSTAADQMTNDVCAEFCADYEYFGTEYGRECYCGNELHEGSAEAPAEDCKMLCGGSAVQYCGGPSRLSTYAKKETEQ